MNYPSVKTIESRLNWLSKIGDPHKLAKQIRGILDGSIDPYTLVPDLDKWIPYGPSEVDIKLTVINLLTKCHGVEYIHDGKVRIYYVNTGESYTNTIIYDSYKQRYIIVSYGDFVERNS